MRPHTSWCLAKGGVTRAILSPLRAFFDAAPRLGHGPDGVEARDRLLRGVEDGRAQGREDHALARALEETVPELVLELGDRLGDRLHGDVLGKRRRGEAPRRAASSKNRSCRMFTSAGLRRALAP